MPDNVEIKLDQLTQAIKGLYAKSSTSQNDMYNALAGLFQRYESLNNISAERILTTLVAEFRKTIDDKYGQTNEYIRNLDSSLRSIITLNQNQNPKMAAEVSKLLNDVASAYSKLSSQEDIIKRILTTVENQQKAAGAEELTKLSDNFVEFSSKFDGITETLNKNFADFLSQIKQLNSKDDLILVNSELSKIANEMSLVTSCVTSIEDRYHELQEIINSIKNADTSSENSTYDTILRINDSLSALKEEVKSNFDKIQIDIKNQNNNQETKNEIVSINNNIQTFKNDIDRLEADIKEPLKEILSALDGGSTTKTLKDLSDDLRDISMEIQSALYNIQTNINDISSNDKDTAQNFVNISQDIQAISPVITEKIENLRIDIQNDNENNLNIIKESFSQTALLIEKLQDDINCVSKSTPETATENISQSSDKISELVNKIEDLKECFTKISIEGIVSKIHQALDSELISKNFLEELKKDVAETVSNGEQLNRFNSRQIEQKLDKIIELYNVSKVNNYAGGNSLEQKVSEIIEHVEKTNLQQIHNSKELLEEVQATSADLSQKISQISSNEKLSEQFKETRDELSFEVDKIKEEISKTVEQINEIVEQGNTEQKQSLQNFEQQNIQNLNETIDSAVEKIKDFSKETSDNSARIATQEVINQLSEKLKDIKEENTGLFSEINTIKEHTEQKLLESVSQISQIIDDKTQEQKKLLQLQIDVEEFSLKLKEYISNFEFQKENIIQEIKEGFDEKFSKIELDIKRVHSNEDNPNYNYTLEDAESDMSKIQLALEKHVATSVETKHIQEKMAELKNHILENNKLNHDIEVELGNYSGWMKDLTKKIDDISQKVEGAQGANMEEISTRLVQSEKSRINSAEFNTKMENGLKSIYKNIKNQGEQIDQLTRKVEFLAQTQNENFNPSQFIDIFYDNMTQTKMLSNRVEIMEDKIGYIQEAVEKLLSYVEQE